MAGYTKAKIMTERDQELLRFVGIGGVATLDQIHRRHWTDAKEQTARDRLSQLEKAGWLESQFIDTKHQRGVLAFTLTKRGAAQFPKMEAKRFAIGLPSHAELEQQIMGQDARIKLERQLAERGERLLDWKNERELRSEFYRDQAHYNREHGNAWNEKVWGRPTIDDIADAQAVIEGADGQEQTLDIEIDGQYYGKMLDKKIACFSKSQKPCLWVTTAGRRAERISREIAPHGQIGLMTLDKNGN